MSFLSSLGGNILGNVVNTAFSKWNASNQAKIQNASTKYVNTHKHQWEVQDLRNAGLNPILSATNGMGYANAGSVSMTSNDGGLGSAEASSNTALKVNKMTLENQRDIADMQNDTQKDFNNGVVENGKRANDIQQQNADANSLVSQATALRTNSAIANDKAVTDSVVYKNKCEGDAATSNAASNSVIAASQMKNANTGLERWNTEKEFHTWNGKLKKLVYESTLDDPLFNPVLRKQNRTMSHAINDIGRLVPFTSGYAGFVNSFNP